jgi:hypothetical protein
LKNEWPLLFFKLSFILHVEHAWRSIIFTVFLIANYANDDWNEQESSWYQEAL